MLLAFLTERDGDSCALCGDLVDITQGSGPRFRFGPSIDHIVPLSRGGSNDLTNLRVTHWICNVARGNRDQLVG
jgi:5-methylcytosine-specific restriction endonuclease McrA